MTLKTIGGVGCCPKACNGLPHRSEQRDNPPIIGILYCFLLLCLLTRSAQVIDNSVWLERLRLLFDLDGTLIDTIEDIAAAFSAAIAEEGLEPPTVAETKQVVGRGLVNALKGLLQIRNHPVSEVRFTELFHVLYTYYEEHPVVYSKPFDGMIELVSGLQDTYQLGVISNKDHELTQRIVSELAGDISWSVVRGMDDEYPRKPDVGAFTPFVKKMDLGLEEMLLIGDSEVDYQSARGANMDVILVSWGFRPREALVALEGSRVVDSVEELKEAIYALQ